MERIRRSKPGMVLRPYQLAQLFNAWSWLRSFPNCPYPKGENFSLVWQRMKLGVLRLMAEIWLTSWYDKYPIIDRVLCIPGGAGFLPSTVCRSVPLRFTRIGKTVNWAIFKMAFDNVWESTLLEDACSTSCDDMFTRVALVERIRSHQTSCRKHACLQIIYLSFIERIVLPFHSSSVWGGIFTHKLPGGICKTEIRPSSLDPLQHFRPSNMIS